MSPKLTPVADAELDVQTGRKLDPIDRVVGAQIKMLRARQGMSQHELARSVGVTYQQMQKYERGTNRVSISMLCRLASSLDADPAQIVSAAAASDPPTFSWDAEVLAVAASRLSPRIQRRLSELVDAMCRSGAGTR